MFHNYKIRNLNIKLIIAAFLLTLIGLAVVTSANSDYMKNQILGMALGLAAMAVVAMIDYDFILQFSWLYYIGDVVILVVVLLFGHDSHGAQRWIDLGFIRFQPSELSKILLILFFACMLMRWEDEINTPKCLVKLAILAGIPLVLILKEPNLSTTIVTFLIIAAMIFMAGLDYRIVGIVLAVAIPLVILIVLLVLSGHGGFLEGYQGNRILAWLRPEDYPSLAYQQQNSIMAIGSGQITGKGLFNDAFDSVKNGNFISEPQTIDIRIADGLYLRCGWRGAWLRRRHRYRPASGHHHSRVFSHSQESQGSFRQTDLFRDWGLDRISEFCKNWRSNRAFAQHRSASALRQLRSYLPGISLYRARSRAECWHAGKKQKQEERYMKYRTGSP